MRALITVFLLAGIILAGCGGGSKDAKLESLKKQQQQIAEKIRQLEEEIAAEGQSGQSRQAVNVKLRKLEKTVFNHSIEIRGKVVSDMNIYVPSQSQTLIRAIHVKEGDKVRKGQLLAESDGSIVERQISSMKVNLDLATTVYERQERLWKQEIGSEIQYLQAKSNKEMLEKQMASLNEQYKLTKIISPIDGSVDRIDLKVGESGMFGGIRVVQMNALKVEAAVSEQYITSINVGDMVSVYISSLDTTLERKITSVSKVIDNENRTFSIEFPLPSGIKNIRPNMIAVLSITDYSNQEAIVVPMNVVQRRSDEYFVFVADKSKDISVARRVKIKPGKIQNNQAEVLAGLKEGDYLIHVGFANLRDGDILKIN